MNFNVYFQQRKFVVSVFLLSSLDPSKSHFSLVEDCFLNPDHGFLSIMSIKTML